MTKLALDERAVRALATEESFKRGCDYARRGAVSALIRYGNRLTAQVEGSDFVPYEVAVELHEGGVAETYCSCPYDWGGACKHIVAVLLEYLRAPDVVTERPSLDRILQSLDRDTLAALLLRRAEIDPAFVLWVEVELAADASAGMPASARRTPIDAEPIKRRAEALLSGRTMRWHGDFEIDEGAFDALIGKARPFLEAGDARNALRIIEPVTEALVQEWLKRADWDETLHEFFPLLGQMIAEAALMSELTLEERDDLRARLDVWQGMLDDYGLDDNLQVAVDALEQGWDEIGLADILDGRGHSWPLAGSGDWTSVQLTQARLRVLEISGRTDAFLNLAKAAKCHTDHAAMLVRLGRVPDASAYARENLRSAGEILQLSTLLKDAGEIDAALELAEWGLERNPDDDRSSAMIGLARWLRDSAAALGRNTIAVTAARNAFKHSLSVEDFRVAQRLAGAGWAELRPHLLTLLTAAKHAPYRIEIFLDEGMIDEAVRSVDVENALHDPDNDALLRLVEAAHGSHPDWAIDICERIAATIMDAGQSSRYELAAQWLEKAMIAYDAAGRFDDWIVRIDTLIDEHRRKHKLRPLLKALRPSA